MGRVLAKRKCQKLSSSSSSDENFVVRRNLRRISQSPELNSSSTSDDETVVSSSTAKNDAIKKEVKVMLPRMPNSVLEKYSSSSSENTTGLSESSLGLRVEKKLNYRRRNVSATELFRSPKPTSYRRRSFSVAIDEGSNIKLNKKAQLVRDQSSLNVRLNKEAQLVRDQSSSNVRLNKETQSVSDQSSKMFTLNKRSGKEVKSKRAVGTRFKHKTVESSSGLPVDAYDKATVSQSAVSANKLKTDSVFKIPRTINSYDQKHVSAPVSTTMSEIFSSSKHLNKFEDYGNNNNDDIDDILSLHADTNELFSVGDAPGSVRSLEASIFYGVNSDTIRKPVISNNRTISENSISNGNAISGPLVGRPINRYQAGVLSNPLRSNEYRSEKIIVPITDSLKYNSTRFVNTAPDKRSEIKSDVNVDINFEVKPSSKFDRIESFEDEDDDEEFNGSNVFDNSRDVEADLENQERIDDKIEQNSSPTRSYYGNEEQIDRLDFYMNENRFNPSEVEGDIDDEDVTNDIVVPPDIGQYQEPTSSDISPSTAASRSNAVVEFSEPSNSHIPCDNLRVTKDFSQSTDHITNDKMFINSTDDLQVERTVVHNKHKMFLRNFPAGLSKTKRQDTQEPPTPFNLEERHEELQNKLQSVLNARHQQKINSRFNFDQSKNETHLLGQSKCVIPNYSKFNKKEQNLHVPAGIWNSKRPSVNSARIETVKKFRHGDQNESFSLPSRIQKDLRFNNNTGYPLNDFENNHFENTTLRENIEDRLQSRFNEDTSVRYELAIKKQLFDGVLCEEYVKQKCRSSTCVLKHELPSDLYEQALKHNNQEIISIIFSKFIGFQRLELRLFQCILKYFITKSNIDYVKKLAELLIRQNYYKNRKQYLWNLICGFLRDFLSLTHEEAITYLLEQIFVAKSLPYTEINDFLFSVINDELNVWAAVNVLKNHISYYMPCRLVTLIIKECLNTKPLDLAKCKEVRNYLELTLPKWIKEKLLALMSDLSNTIRSYDKRSLDNELLASLTIVRPAEPAHTVLPFQSDYIPTGSSYHPKGEMNLNSYCEQFSHLLKQKDIAGATRMIANFNSQNCLYKMAECYLSLDRSDEFSVYRPFLQYYIDNFIHNDIRRKKVNRFWTYIFWINIFKNIEKNLWHKGYNMYLEMKKFSLEYLSSELNITYDESIFTPAKRAIALIEICMNDSKYEDCLKILDFHKLWADHSKWELLNVREDYHTLCAVLECLLLTLIVRVDNEKSGLLALLVFERIIYAGHTEITSFQTKIVKDHFQTLMESLLSHHLNVEAYNCFKRLSSFTTVSINLLSREVNRALIVIASRNSFEKDKQYLSNMFNDAIDFGVYPSYKVSDQSINIHIQSCWVKEEIHLWLVKYMQDLVQYVRKNSSISEVFCVQIEDTRIRGTYPPVLLDGHINSVDNAASLVVNIFASFKPPMKVTRTENPRILKVDKNDLVSYLRCNLI